MKTYMLIIFPFPNSQILSTSQPYQFHVLAVFLFPQIIIKQKTRLRTNKQKPIRQKKIPEQNKQHTQKTVEFALCWPTAPGHGAFPGVWLTYPVTPIEEN